MLLPRARMHEGAISSLLVTPRARVREGPSVSLSFCLFVSLSVCQSGEKNFKSEYRQV